MQSKTKRRKTMLITQISGSKLFGKETEGFVSRCLGPLFALVQIIIRHVSASAPCLTKCHERRINFSFMNPSIRQDGCIRFPWHFQYDDRHPSKMTELAHNFFGERLLCFKCFNEGHVYIFIGYIGEI